MHRLGSIISLGTPVNIGPDSGPPTTAPNTWEHVFPVDPLAKFVMIHLNGASLGASDKVEILLGYDTDVYKSSWGPDFWSRPIRGDQPVTIRYIRTGGGGGHVTFHQYGRGEGMAPSGSNAGLDNTNADVFLMAPSYEEPLYFPSYSNTPGHTSPTWQPVACAMDDPIIQNTARSVGMYVVVDGHGSSAILSSCTATLIAPDLIITAGHCVFSNEDVKTGWFTLDFQTNCNRTTPSGYAPKFHKLKRLVRTGGDDGHGGNQRPPGDTRAPLDYSIIQIETPPGGIGAPPVPIRPPTVPLVLNEPLFIIHHRRGTTKKVSRFATDNNCKVKGVGSGSAFDINSEAVQFDCSVDYGSSGSSVFDAQGRIVANLSRFRAGQSIKSIWNDFLTEPPPLRDMDIVLVFDRSGSMSLPGLTSVPKLNEAKQAAALFVSLLRTTVSDQVGLVSFSTTPSPDRALTLTAAAKGPLIGPSPFTSGQIGGLIATGMTTIGGGLQTAVGMFPTPGPTTNTRAILLMTDGLENTSPFIAGVESSLSGTRLNIIGFGTEASLDGPRLTTLARNHDGIYTRANEGLALKKYFALAFGRIFNFGTSLDPMFTLPANVPASAPVEISVCGDSRLIAVLGWDPNKEGAVLLLEVTSPAGAVITSGTPGVVAASGQTWAHLSFALPFAGERDGTWKVRVVRPGGGGEFPPPAPQMRYFLTTLAEGGPFFTQLTQPPLYTGDVLNPLVLFRAQSGHLHADITVEIESPTDGTGNILVKHGLGTAGSAGGDPIDARTNTLFQLEQATNSELIKSTKRTVSLFDDGEHEDGGMEPDGIFGNPLASLTKSEGHYTFHAVATYGHECVARREVSWSVYVAVGIDPDNTDVKTEPAGDLPDGKQRVRITITPRDKYGNYVGPGRSDSIGVGPTEGSEPVGPVIDNGDGSYTVDVAWDPASGEPPGVGVSQPGRPPLHLKDPRGLFHYSVKILCGTQPECRCDTPSVRPGAYATEVNIHNFHDTPVTVLKSIIPVVLAGAAPGREPGIATSKARDHIVLPPHSATMDDCQRVARLLFGAEPSGPLTLTIGFLEIISTQPLNVTAVYTVSDLQTGAVSIDVEQVRERAVLAATPKPALPHEESTEKTHHG